MEILCVVIHLIVIGKSVSFHFGSLLQTLPPSVPEDFKMKIMEMYSKNPEVFGDSVVKGKPIHIMKIHKTKQIPKALTIPKPHVETSPAFQMQMPIPVPLQMYPQFPQIVPMHSYFEPVIHDHPPLSEIRRIIKEDKARWANHNKVKTGKKHNRYNSNSDTESSDSSEEHNFHYYDDVFKVRGN